MMPAESLVGLLKEQGKSFACAESCTGGLLAAAVTDVPGASEVFGLGVVTYSNAAKMRLLNVSEDTLRLFGAVSSETASEMAKGLYKLSSADICISITGIAGPGGGSIEKPVGLVYIGCCTVNDVHVVRFNFHGGRDAVRKQTVAAALNLAAEVLQGV